MVKGGRKAQAARKKISSAKNTLKRAAKSVKGRVKRATKKLTKKKQEAPAVEAKTPKPRSAPAKAQSAARRPRREPDIPIDRIEAAYTPKTSLKAGFRADGSDRQRDQEFADGVADERWNDEDRFTNKSGDPRIGTHGRSYEPGEKRTKKIDYETE